MYGWLIEELDRQASPAARRSVIEQAVAGDDELELVDPAVGDEFVERLHAPLNFVACKASATIREVVSPGVRVKGERDALYHAQVLVDDPVGDEFYI